jgi:RNA polymerase sigma-70 factor (ECF subfamily)
LNVAFGKMRARARRPAAIAVADLEAALERSDGDRPESPARALERREDQARVYAALEKLAPKKRLVLYLHEIEGRDLKDIAYLVDSNAVTVRTRLFYAKREFYKLLAEAAPPEVP